jgi:hypothetical protein
MDKLEMWRQCFYLGRYRQRKEYIYKTINEQIEKMHKKEDNSSKMSYNGITTNHELRELLSYEYKYT